LPSASPKRAERIAQDREPAFDLAIHTESRLRAVSTDCTPPPHFLLQLKCGYSLKLKDQTAKRLDATLALVPVLLIWHVPKVLAARRGGGIGR